MKHPTHIPVIAAIALSASAGCASEENTIAEGDPIPNTSILSCGDALLDSQSAPPTGGLQGVSLQVDMSGTTLVGRVIWQASCPTVDTGTDAETEFQMDSLRLYRDEATVAGAEVGESPIEFTSVLTCTSNSGVSGTDDIGPVAVTDLNTMCSDHKAEAAGGPLYVHVGLFGKAITCSDEVRPLELQTRVTVDCPD